MDKIAANNHFVVLRKEIKKAKAMVSGNLIRKIAKNKEEKEKLGDEDKRKKIDDKNSAILEEIKMLKTMDSYNIAKLATLKPDQKEWDKLISDNKATTEMRLTARVICKNNIQKQVAKFRSDNPECDEWLDEYIEYREKKRQLIDADKPKFKRKAKTNEKVVRDKNPDQVAKNNPHSKKIQKKPDNRKVADVISDTKDLKKTKKETKEDDESLHPSWASKKKEKELLQAAISKGGKQAKRIVFKT